ncbi:MAG: tRNA (adenosine(37)-N6)-threonylcarbamoyltransferase complex ATPase subunit type 1 TsaE [Myxococcales bacterium]|nr:tRNA (adenosine(37)-N6)-threonylcarbamoyltransferase complex ATPase subunit type 1 TsaE [Myxococcales bacterium]
MKRINTRGPGETRRLAARLGKLVRPGDVLALSGGLGAGKTCFVQGFARGLGVAKGTRIASPTFNIVLEYPARIPLHHIDLYRLTDECELAEIGLDHYLYGAGVCAVEWLDRFPALAPPDRLEIELTIAGPRARTLTVTGHGPRGAALLAAWPPGGGHE